MNTIHREALGFPIVVPFDQAGEAIAQALMAVLNRQEPLMVQGVEEGLDAEQWEKLELQGLTGGVLHG